MTQDLVDYSRREFWDLRYLKPQEVDNEWLITPDELEPHLSPFLSPESEILIIGSGDSKLSEYFYHLGFQYITNIDFSAVAVANLTNRSHALPEMEHHVMDATRLEFPAASFDVVVDKATTDSVLCGSDSFIRMAAVLQEVYRVLKPNGLLFTVSHAEPGKRLQHLKTPQLPWAVNHKKVAVKPRATVTGVPTVHMYACKKPANDAG